MPSVIGLLLFAMSLLFSSGCFEDILFTMSHTSLVRFILVPGRVMSRLVDLLVVIFYSSKFSIPLHVYH